MSTPAETLALIAEAEHSVAAIGARSARGESSLSHAVTATRFDVFCILLLGVVIGLGVALVVFASGIALAEVWP